MRKVKIISGAYGHHEGGRLKVKDSKSGPFELADAEADRIVSLGVAEYSDETGASDVATPDSDAEEHPAGENPPETEDATEGEENADSNAPEYSVDSSVSVLRAIAKENGIVFKVGTSKEEMVAALDEYFNDEMPDVSAADPE